MAYTIGVHLMSPEVAVRAAQHSTGRVSLEIEHEGDGVVSITVASQRGDDGLFVDAARLAAQLEIAARQLRSWCRPVDDGDHFIRPDERAAHDAAEAAAWSASFDVPLAETVA